MDNTGMSPMAALNIGGQELADTVASDVRRRDDGVYPLVYSKLVIPCLTIDNIPSRQHIRGRRARW